MKSKGLGLGIVVALGIALAFVLNRQPKPQSMLAPKPPISSNSPTAPTARADKPCDIRLERVNAGLDFEYFRGDTGKNWTIEPHGGGAAVLDYDNDGSIDLFFVNGRQLPLQANDSRTPAQLFRRAIGARFEAVTSQAQVGVTLYGQGCAAADFDNDGFDDLIVTGWKNVAFLRNQGDGRFQDITTTIGVAAGEWNMGATFADLDGDGALDLYVANYVVFDPSNHAICMNKDRELGYCGPGNYASSVDFLYVNNRAGRYIDVSAASGIQKVVRPAFGAVAADFNNDGRPDLLVANDGVPNSLFENQTTQLGAPRFEEVASERGIAISVEGRPQANMGIAVGDVDHDGNLDVGLSHYFQEYFSVYLNRGKNGFEDASRWAGTYATTRTKMGWGAGFVDLDGDSWLDLFVVNGHINNHGQSAEPYRMTAQVYQNRKGDGFDEVTDRAGPYFQELKIGRGTVVLDANDDGRPDLLVVQHHEPVALLENRSPSANHWLTLDLVGVLSNRDGYHARVRLTLPGENGRPGPILLREACSGEGYLGSNDKRLFVGLGQYSSLAQLEIQWPSGLKQAWNDLRTDQQMTIVEGREPNFRPRTPR